MSSIKNIKHVVFDFDGVIVDSERKKFADLQAILENQGYMLSDSLFESFIGKKRGHFLSELGVSHIAHIMQRVHEEDKHFAGIELKTGLRELLALLKQQGITMHIATGSSAEFVFSLLDLHGIRDYFSIILTGDEVAESKPNPAVYVEIKSRLNSSQIVVIEDSPAGVLAAKTADLFVIGLGTNLDAGVVFANLDDVQSFFWKEFGKR